MGAQTCRRQPLSNFDEKTKDYRLLELDGIIVILSNLLLFSDQEINWLLVTEVVSNETFMGGGKKSMFASFSLY